MSFAVTRGTNKGVFNAWLFQNVLRRAIPHQRRSHAVKKRCRTAAGCCEPSVSD